jgi:hypothetical protein
MKTASREFIQLLQRPEEANQLSPVSWTRMLAIARAANLLGTLAGRIAKTDVIVPEDVQRHLIGISRLSQRQHDSVRWEVHQLARALARRNIPVVLLKGAAYVLGELPVCDGRLFGDIDILVPRTALGDIEIAMMTHGWASTKQEAYDQRYYRQWMHELPPMTNVRRGTVLDIHHTLLPLTARLSPDPGKIIDAASEIPGLAPLRLPILEDLVIHSITHLFHEGELHNGLRDLFDIDGLLRVGTARQPAFWSVLLNRAEELQLIAPLFLGLHFSTRLLGTPVPAFILEEARRRGTSGPLALAALEVLYDRSLQPMYSLCETPFTSFTRWLLYVRAHWLRMPPSLLATHLARKFWINLFPDRKAVDNNPILG